jgi:phosphoribosylaminoimidazolecarboxamide formyltransferase/IMP cyclohydrolase
MVRQHHGKQLSYNNLLDLDSARRVVEDFEVPACAIVKHNNPCGVALGRTALEAYTRAFACDPMSAFGGVIALNRPVDKDLAEALSQQFIEVLFAPGYDDDALEILTRKENIRILQNDERRGPLPGEPQLRQVAGGLLVQDADAENEERGTMEVVTKRSPSEQEWSDMLFGWRVCKHVRSNSIVLTKDLATVGIGAGQMSRVDSVRLAIEKAHEHGHDLTGAALASDAFFPFADGPQLAIEAGVKAIIQPGGSKRDEEVIAAADEAGIAMVFARRRHFRH